MTKRLLLIPRWSGTPQSDWYPWLKRELAALKSPAFEQVVIADMPHPDVPVVAAWVSRVKTLLGSDPELNAQTVLAGHSVGCQAAMRALAEMPAGTRVAGLFFVAGWFTTDAPWDTLMPWIETPLDLDGVRARSGKTIVMISDNDRHRRDWRSNKQAWEERVGASVHLVRGADHFNGPAYPAVLETLLNEFGGNEHVRDQSTHHIEADRGR